MIEIDSISVCKPLKNPGASIRQRLLNYAKSHDDDSQRILNRYAIERFLYRLSRTEAVERYVLKGAMLFLTWPDHAYRPTRDLDLLGSGDGSPAAIKELFTHVCEIEEPADGIVFDPVTMRVEPVRRKDNYRVVQLALQGLLDGAVIPVSVDIGFGDHVYPSPTRNRFPLLLRDLRPADILMYPPDTVIAEKLEIMLHYGEAHSRMKDVYDIWIMTRIFPFDLGVLVEAIGGTLERRKTMVPSDLPAALTPRFAQRPHTRTLWSAFLRHNPPSPPPPPFQEIVAELGQFLEPVIAALALPQKANKHWDPAHSNWE